MGWEKEKPVLDIILDSQHLVLKGTGHDFEPTRLSGQLSLLLAEPTPLRELNLQFRGKARLPPSASDSLIAGPPTHVVCSHDWSFLEGDKKHIRTLKAGRHLFPFSLDISGSLPSSIFTTALGGISISYRLRAIAVRPGLAYNLQHLTPVHIVRSFTPEALEYQQTLEIENTWPDKLMYAVTLPHKAWAAGDTLVAILKFSPLLKGVAVQSIVSMLCETTKVQARGGTQEDTKVVASVRHEMAGGRAVEVDSRDSSPSVAASTSAQGNEDGFDNSDIITYIKLPIPARSNFQTLSPLVSPNVSLPTTPSYPTSPESAPPVTSAAALSPLPTFPIKSITPSHSVGPITVTHRIRWSIYILNQDGHTSELRCSLPVHILDGRVLDDARSCSILTRRMVLEMVGLRAVATELGLGSVDGDASETNGESASGSTVEELPSYRAHVRDRVANMFLPEAVTMRVSNPWIGRVGGGTPGQASGNSSPEAPGEGSGGYLSRTTSGADIASLLQPQHQAVAQGSSSPPLSRGPRSGLNTPGNPPLVSTSHQQLPHAPVAGESTPLDWVNSELLLSLSDEPIRRLWGDQAASSTNTAVAPPPTATGNVETTPTTAEGGNRSGSRWGRRWGSRAQSRVQSQNPSPERTTEISQRLSTSTSARPSLDGGFDPPSPLGSNATQAEGTSSGSGGHVGHRPGHSRSNSMRNLQSLLKATMKPFTTLTGHGYDTGHGATSGEHSMGSTPPSLPHSQSPPILPPLQSTESHTITSAAHSAIDTANSTHPNSNPSPHPSTLSGPALLHRALTEVPDYSIASRGFIGGVPPLSSMRGLPSYEEAARSQTPMDDSDAPQVQPSAGLESALSTTSVDPTANESRRSASRERRGTLSESDLVGFFRRRHGTVVAIPTRNGQGQQPGILQTLDGERAEDASDEDENDEGIQMRGRRR